MLLRGEPAETRARALALLGALPPRDVLWVSPSERGLPFDVLAPGRTDEALGRAYDAVVMDLSAGLDAESLARCEGLVWGGGALIVRMPEGELAPRAMREALAVFPYGPDDAGSRAWARVRDALAAIDEGPRPVAPAPHDVVGGAAQAEVVSQLVARLRDEAPSLTVLLADRGRGKSSALGLALAALPPEGVVVSALGREAAAEVLRFAASRGGPEPRFVTPAELLASSDEEPRVVVIDEAARVPVPLLRALVRRLPRTRFAMATTTGGYEGTGRGFVLRFVEWARAERDVVRITLDQPMRWDAGDPLERTVREALWLDAEPAPEASVRGCTGPSECEHGVIDRDRLVREPELASDVLGLLAQAHYRTAPGDVVRALDAPNLALHALSRRGRVVAVSLVAKEGGLDAARCRAMAEGALRIRGHALADTLVTHAARPDAGELSLIRSVRIAVHPALRRLGLGRALVEHVHASYAPDAFGTLFGARPELIELRRALGYEVVRLGVARGARSGEPSVVMMRPVSARAIALVRDLRVELARELPLQLALIASDEALVVEDALARSLEAGLETPAPLDAAALRARVERYVASARPFDAAPHAVTRFVEAHRSALDALDAQSRALIEGRVLSRRAWASVAAGAGMRVEQAMRALRPAVAQLLARTSAAS